MLVCLFVYGGSRHHHYYYYDYYYYCYYYDLYYYKTLEKKVWVLESEVFSLERQA